MLNYQRVIGKSRQILGFPADVEKNNWAMCCTIHMPRKSKKYIDI
jgi:hypothetical protein